uniref:RELB proto-onco, NF-kB subunit n=1 Tax=Leptobrachium leishanense TaxID=445787 RepID=A0A8C5Q4H5_9ANUR
MKEEGRTGPLDELTEDPSLDDVMDLIRSESQSDNQPLHPSCGILVPRGAGPILETVTVAPSYTPLDNFVPLCVPHHGCPEPELVIIEQPKQRGMRFRYQCEGRSAGSILGQNSTDQNKTLPAIEVINCEGIPEVRVRVCLVWKDPPHRIHPHSLVGKDCHDGICEITLHPRDEDTQHSFSNLGIQCVRKKEIEQAVQLRLDHGIDPFKAGMWRNHEEVDLNVVRLCFQGSCLLPGGQRAMIPPVLSEPIYDKKSTNTSELKICRINKDSGFCEGGEEVYILCDKVQKEDIQVMFGNEKWEARADFAQADVHRQIAIVLKTPPYQDLNITEPVLVSVFLQRVTDSIRSEGVTFTYKPRADCYGVGTKRRYTPQDDLSDPDPHCIQVKRNRTMPTFLEHCGPEEDYYPHFGGTCPPEHWTNYLPLDEEPAEHFPTLEEDIALNCNPSLADFSYQDPSIYPPFDPLCSNVNEDPTTGLVASSLAITEEGAQDFMNLYNKVYIAGDGSFNDGHNL